MIGEKLLTATKERHEPHLKSATRPQLYWFTPLPRSIEHRQASSPGAITASDVLRSGFTSASATSTAGSDESCDETELRPPSLPAKTPLDPASDATRPNSAPPPLPAKTPLDPVSDATRPSCVPPPLPAKTPLDPASDAMRRNSAPPELPPKALRASTGRPAFEQNQAVRQMMHHRMWGPPYPVDDQPQFHHVPSNRPPAQQPGYMPGGPVSGKTKAAWRGRQQSWQDGGSPLSAPPGRSTSAPPASKTRRFFSGLQRIFTAPPKVADAEPVSPAQSSSDARIERMENDYPSASSSPEVETRWNRDY